MAALNLQRIIDGQGLDPKVLASELFPGNKHPELSLRRVLKGEAALDAEQISKIAQLTGLTFDELYAGRVWRTSATDTSITFESDDYKAVLDTDTFIAKIYRKDSLIHEEAILRQGIPLKDFLNFVNEIIK